MLSNYSKCRPLHEETSLEKMVVTETQCSLRRRGNYMDAIPDCKEGAEPNSEKLI